MLDPYEDKRGLGVEQVAEGPEKEAGKSHGSGQREDPGQRQVAHGAHLQARVIGHHRARYAGR